VQGKVGFSLTKTKITSINKVRLTFYGKVLNIDYTRKLAEVPDLSLNEIISLAKYYFEVLKKIFLHSNLIFF